MKVSLLDGKLYRLLPGPDADLEQVDSIAEADVLYFQCPKCAAGCVRVLRDDGTGYAEGAHFISVPFSAHDGRPAMPHKPGPSGNVRWGVSGKTLADVTTTPSIQIIGGCAWHGYIRGGEAVPA